MLEMGWILAVYGLGVLCVHLAYGLQVQKHPPLFFNLFNKRIRSRRFHDHSVAALHASVDRLSHISYVFIISKKYPQIEWLIRSLLFVAWLKGRPIEIYILDRNGQGEKRRTKRTSRDPNDHTMAIVRKFADQGLVHLLSAPNDADAQATLTKLMQRSIVLELDEQTSLRTVFQ